MGSESLKFDRTSLLGGLPDDGAIDRARTTDSVIRVFSTLIESIKADEAVLSADADIDRAVQAGANPSAIASLRANLQALKLQIAER
jgi:hypothetical protein